MLTGRFREINSNTREGRDSRVARFFGDRGCKDESRGECCRALVVVCGCRRLPLLPTPGKRGPCPVETTGLEQCPECQDARVAITPPALAGPLQPLGHEHEIPAFHGTRTDRVARIGDFAVGHAFSIVPKDIQLPVNVGTALPFRFR